MGLFGRGGIVTEAMVDRALADVRAELVATGLATRRLAGVRVTRPWVQLNDRVGYYVPGGGGTIGVPAVSLGRLAEYRGQAPWTAVRDILRHEFGHALADLHPSTTDQPEFARVFHGPHGSEGPAGAYAYHAHVSEYAASMPSEDFAETVMVYLRCRGAIARFRGRPVLHRKLRFVAALPGLLGDDPTA